MKREKKREGEEEDEEEVSVRLKIVRWKRLVERGRRRWRSTRKREKDKTGILHYANEINCKYNYYILSYNYYT